MAWSLCVLGTSTFLAAASASAGDFDFFGIDLGIDFGGIPWALLVKGNDTGGIIPWTPQTEVLARDWAGAFCANYGKYPRITGVHRQYGDYISFNCLWDPAAARYALPALPTARPR